MNRLRIVASVGALALAALSPVGLAAGSAPTASSVKVSFVVGGHVAGAGALASAQGPNEFDSPSWTSLPAASSYNTTPSCQVAVGQPVCDVPQSAWPPPDPGNPEWFQHLQNADGSWDTYRTGYINSAYWPAEKRPDIEEYAIQKYGYNYKHCASYLPHYCFLVDAEAVGYPITHTPAVGDLWLAPGECLLWAYNEQESEGSSCDPNSNTDWYMGYVERVLPDGSFVQSWGGSTTPADSGLEVTLFSGAMDPYTD